MPQDGLNWAERMRSRAPMGGGVVGAEEAAVTANPVEASGADEAVVPVEKKGPRGAWETITGAGVERVPILGTAKEFSDMADLLTMARRAQRGRASQRDLQILNNWVAEQERGSTFMGTVADITLSIPKFVGELFVSAGVGKLAASGAKVAGKEALNTLVRQLAKKGALDAVKQAAYTRAKRKAFASTGRALAKREIFGVGLKQGLKGAAIEGAKGAAKTAGLVGTMEVLGQTVAHGVGLEDKGGIISAMAARKAMNRVQWQQDEFGRFQVAMDQAIPGTLDLLPQGFVDAMIEVGSEMSGGVLTEGMGRAYKKAATKFGIDKIPLASSLKALQMKAADKWLGEGGKRTMQDLLDLAERGQFHGIMGEFLEERAGGMARIAAGMVPDWEEDFNGFESAFPGFTDAAAEIAAFSMLPMGAAGGAAANELRIRIGERDMTPEMVMKTRAMRRQARKGDVTGTLAIGSLRGEIQQRRVGENAQQVAAADALAILYGRGVIEPTEGALTAEELDQIALSSRIAGGNAAMDQQPFVGNGVRGSTKNIMGEAHNQDPISASKLLEMATDMAGEGAVMLKGREENIERDKQKGRRWKSLSVGVDAANKVIGLLKSKNIGEAVEKVAAVQAETIMRDHGAIAGIESEVEREAEAIHNTFGAGGYAGLSSRAAFELEAVGSHILQGVRVEPTRKVRQYKRMLKRALSEEGSESDKVVALKERLADAKRDLREARAKQILAGYQAFMRMEITADGSAHMPAVTDWFHEAFRANHPKQYEEWMTLMEGVTRFRYQGSQLRAASNMSDLRDPKRRLKKQWQLMTTKSGWAQLKQYALEEGVGIEYATRAFAARMRLIYKSQGQELPASMDLFKLEQAYPGQAKAMAAMFTYDRVLTWDRKIRANIRPLFAIAPLVRGRMAEFNKVLDAHRAVAIWEDKPAELDEEGNVVNVGGHGLSVKQSTESLSREAGISYEDAKKILDDAPEELFEAAFILMEWWESIMDFMAEGSTIGREFVERMRFKDPGFYVSLFREFDEVEAINGPQSTMMRKALGEDVTKDLEGSMEALGPALTNMEQQAIKMFDLAFHFRQIEVIQRASTMPGMQDMVVMYAPDEVKEDAFTARELLNFLEDLRATEIQKQAARDARDAGESAQEVIVDPSIFGAVMGILKRDGIEEPSKLLDAMIQKTRVMPASIKGDGRQVIPVKDQDGRWMLMEIRDPDLVRWFNYKLTPESMNVVQTILNIHKKFFTFTTTTARILFQWFRNPAKDIGGAIINTRTSGDAYPFMLHCLASIGREFKRAWKGGENVSWGQDLFAMIGMEYAVELATDSFEHRKTIERLAGGKKGKFYNAWEWTLGMLQAPERGVRTAEIELFAAEMLGVEKLTEMPELTEDQMIELVLAAKRVSTNFTVAGRTARKINTWVPFFNAAIQGPRATFDAIMADGDPQRRSDKLTRAFMYYTVPGLLYWWMVKDEDWYKELSAKEKSSSWFIPVGNEEFLVMPLPFEIGTIFSAIPVAFVDAAYRENASDTEWAIGRILEATLESSGYLKDLAPMPVPPAGRAWLDQKYNTKSYWGTPIVSDTLLRLEERAQYDEFTGYLARWIGEKAANIGINDGSGWSPKRIEHLAKSVAGPLGSDLMGAFGSDAKDMDGFRGMRIIGPQFKEALAYPKSVTELYETYEKVQKRFDTKIDEESPDEMDVRLALRDAIKAVSSISMMLRGARGEMRSALKKERIEITKKALGYYKAGQIPEGERAVLRERRKELEAEKKAIKAEFIAERKKTLGFKG